MKALIDGDIVLFRCGFACERNVWHLAWGPKQEGPGWDNVQTFRYKKDALDHLDKVVPGQFSRVEGEDYELFPEKELEPLPYALQSIKTLMTRIGEAVDCDPGFDFEVMLSGGKNFRYDVAKTRPYKGTRKEEHRPTYEAELRAYLIENYDCTIAENEEADDLIGIRATELGEGNCVIVTIDKDLDMIPGTHYNWVHDIMYEVPAQEAMTAFHVQLMTGDSTDNIPGLPKIGPGKAKKALHGIEDLNEQLAEVSRMYQMYSPKEDWMEYMKEQGNLIWIRRRKGEMWSETLLDHLVQESIFGEADLSEMTLEAD